MAVSVLRVYVTQMLCTRRTARPISVISFDAEHDIDDVLRRVTALCRWHRRLVARALGDLYLVRQLGRCRCTFRGGRAFSHVRMMLERSLTAQFGTVVRRCCGEFMVTQSHRK